MDAPKPALERIVVGMDFRAPSIEMARWVAHALAPGAELVMTHALDRQSTDLAGEVHSATQQLHEIARAVAAPPRYRAAVRDGGAARAILDVATDCGADLIVVGPHGGRESTRGIGTTAERLIRTSPIPVLLVANPKAPPLKQLLVAMDGGDLTHSILAWTDFLARREAGAVAFMHVVDPHQDERHPRDVHDDRWLSTLAAESPAPSRAMSFTVIGKPADEILQAATRLDADLVVMGRRSQRRRLSGVLGSTASDLLRQAPCPVLIIVDPPDASFDEWGTTGLPDPYAPQGRPSE